MKKVVRILLAILLVATMALTITACKNDCQKGNHEFVLQSTDEATCTAAKVEHYKCANCDETEDRLVGEPLGHNPSASWTSVDGKHYHICSRCDAHLDEADCDRITVTGTAATCVTDGKTDGVQCSVCKHWFTEQTTIPANGSHDYDETIEANVTVTKPATCIEDGTMVVKCKNCDETTTVVIPATGQHNFDETIEANVTITKNATCTEAGSKTVKCADCGTESDPITIPALDHDFDETIEANVTVITPATCATAGSKTVKCSRCTETTTIVIPATGEHNFDETIEANVTITKNATCTEAGSKTVKCADCGTESDPITIPALGHDFDETITANVTIVDPTCGKAGSKTIKCKNCGETKTETIPATGEHSYGEALESISATQHAHVCSVCGNQKDVANHAYGVGEGVAPNHCATCGKDITPADIFAELNKITKSGEYLIDKDNVYQLTGTITSISYAYDGTSASLYMDVNGTEVYCYKLIGDDTVMQRLMVGDTITVNGSLCKYTVNKNLVNEFGQNCTVTDVKYSDVTITWNTPDNATITGLDEKVERYTSVEFTVTPDSADTMVVVTINNKKVESIGNNRYRFDADTDTTIVIELKDANVTNKHQTVKTSETEITIATVGKDSDTGVSYSDGTFTVDGIDFTYQQIARSSNGAIQIRHNSDAAKKTWIYNTSAFSADIKEIVVDFEGTTTDKHILNVELSQNADFTDVVSATITKSSTVLTITDAGCVYVRFSVSGNAGYLNSITIKCESIDDCDNTERFTHHDEVKPTCTDDGNIEYWTCDECGAMFSDALCNNMISSVVDDEHKATGHNIEKVNYLAATCTENGNVEHWICTNGCGMKFLDEDGNTPVTDEASLVLGATGHKYVYTSNGNGTHTGVCVNDSSHIDTTNTTCTSDTYEFSDKEHWQICSDCKAEFGREYHDANTTCKCGAIRLSYVVVDDDEKAIDVNDLNVTFPAYAKVGDTITVTITSNNYEIVMVVSGDNELVQQEGTNDYRGTVETAVITIYVQELESAKFIGATVDDEDIGFAEITRNDEEDKLEENTALQTGDVLKIYVYVIEEEYVPVAIVTQGSTSTVVALTDDGDGDWRGTYDVADKGDVSVAISFKKIVTVTINEYDGAKTTLTVTNGEATVENGGAVLTGDTLTISVTNATGYEAVVEVTGATDNGDGTYTVTGDVTITVTAYKLITIHYNVTGGTADVAITKGEATVNDGDQVAAGAVLALTVTGTDMTVTVTCNDATVTNVGGIWTVTLGKDLTVSEINIAITLEDAKPAFVKLTTANQNDLLKNDAVVLIVYEAGNVCFNGSLDTLDAAGNYMSVTITNNQIEYSEALSKVTFTLESITNVADGYYIKSESGYYIGTTKTSNSIATSDKTQYTNTITVDANGVTITSSNGLKLLYMSGTGSRFRYYSSNQQPIAVYVLTTVA